MVKIVKYSKDYLNELTNLYNMWDDIPDLTTKEMQKTLDDVFINTNNQIFLAVEDNQVLGYLFVGVCYFVGTKPFLEIIQIMMKENCRGKGIGKQIMKYVMNMYKEQGITQVRLHSRFILTNAHEFYKKLGFKEFKQSKFFKLDM